MTRALLRIDPHDGTTMTEYKAPIDDMQFILRDLLQLSDYAAELDCEALSDELIDAVLQEGARFAEREIHPLNASGDREGCRLEEGRVISPAGFKEAYKLFAEGGWLGMTADPEYEGQGLPHALNFATGEMVSSANPSFGMYTGMNKGAVEVLESSATEELKQGYLPRLNSGEWSATMNLTEAHAGTDLGLLKTKAVPRDDGSYLVSGTKIFISSGEHELSDNIIHLVLARLPDAPAGTKGISLFLVPKILPDAGGGAGERNNVECLSLEKKMGLKASATCVMNYDNAVGYIVGHENAGLPAMFRMMNSMRLMVGGQGLGAAELAYQNAAAYVKERRQGRGPGSGTPAGSADPLIEHPDIRRMLLFCRAYVEGARALTYWASLQVDISEKSPDREKRREAGELLALLTPVIKAYLSEKGEEVVSMALQCFGGHGYIVETGVEQIYRDVRISKIYEGATGVQALDLVGRKVLMNRGENLKRFVEQVRASCADCPREIADFRQALSQSVDDLEAATRWLFENAAQDPAVPGSVSVNYLTLMGLVCMGYMWMEMALKANAMLQDGAANKDFLNDKITVGRFYTAHFLPDTGSLLRKIQAGATPVMSLEAGSF